MQQIVAAQLNAAADLDPCLKTNFAVKYVVVSAEQRRAYVASGKHFGLLVKGNDCIAMWPVYDANDALVSLRFRSGLRDVGGLREIFEEVWSAARPLVDLRLPILDAVEKSG